MTEHEGRIKKVRALLAQAESTKFPEEAASFTAKAHKLMQIWAIEEAALHGSHIDSEVMGTIKIDIPSGPYNKWHLMLVNTIANAHHCTIIANGKWKYGKNGKACKTGYDATVYGYGRDLKNVEMMHASILLQMEREWQHPITQNSMVVTCGGDGGARVRFRASYIRGFTARMGQLWKEADKAAKEEVGEEVGSMALVSLRNRKAEAESYMDEQVGETKKMGKSKGKLDFQGYKSGQDAADRAASRQIDPNYEKLSA